MESSVRGTKVAPAIGLKSQYWYGRVNYWTESELLLSKEVKYMKKYGVTGYIIEMASWRSLNGDIRKSPSSSKYKKVIKTIKSRYKYLHKLYKSNGLWLFVGIVNDNALSNKHGNKAIDPDHYYNNVANDLLNIIIDDGPENVIIQPISELYKSRVKNHPGVAWQKSTITKLKKAGFLTCNNDNYGRPSGYANCHYKAWHPDRIKDIPSSGTSKDRCFIISDTGGIISELNGGTDCDKVDAKCKVSKIKEWKERTKGYCVVGYYDYKRKSFNKDAIKAMGTR